MSLFLRFKKDYFNYLISIILPAFIAGISIPVFKHLLGAQGYGSFSIYYNAVLICNAITTTWITQSIYRFYPSNNNKELFARLSIALSCLTQVICFVPVLVFSWYLKNTLVFGILLCAAIFTISLQFLYMAIAQSSFLSRKTIYSETIRAVTYILIAVTLLLFTHYNYLYVLFIAVIVSFALSIVYLRRQTSVFFLQIEKDPVDPIAELSLMKLARRFFNYGAPLSMWIVFAYLLSYVDKILILKNLGPEAQGNYQAIFDLLSRGITVLISPIIISLFPLLAMAYEKREIIEIRQLVKKIILFELAGFALATILYWWFGANLLFLILKIPNTDTYRVMGFLVIAGTFVWQLAIVAHERYVLKLKSVFLLAMIVTAFLTQLIFYWIFRKSGNPLLYPAGYLFSAFMYLLLVSYSQITVVVKSLFVPYKALFCKR